MRKKSRKAEIFRKKRKIWQPWSYGTKSVLTANLSQTQNTLPSIAFGLINEQLIKHPVEPKSLYELSY